MKESLGPMEQELRRAVESQRHAEVQRLVLDFCAAVEGHVRSLPPGDPRIAEIAGLTHEVLQWTRTMMQAARACLVLQLEQIPKVKRYIPVPSAVSYGMQLDG